MKITKIEIKVIAEDDDGRVFSHDIVFDEILSSRLEELCEHGENEASAVLTVVYRPMG